MNMHILSEHQFQMITQALDEARAALIQCQHVELDLTKPKQTVPLPAGEKITRKTQSQGKVRLVGPAVGGGECRR